MAPAIGFLDGDQPGRDAVPDIAIGPVIAGRHGTSLALATSAPVGRRRDNGGPDAIADGATDGTTTINAPPDGDAWASTDRQANATFHRPPDHPSHPDTHAARGLPAGTVDLPRPPRFKGRRPDDR